MRGKQIGKKNCLKYVLINPHRISLNLDMS
jgi:hypothetical protein